MRGYKKWLSTVILLTLIIAPCVCQAELYIGAYIGPNFATNVNPSFNFSRGMFYRTAENVAVDPSFIVGGKIGFWFTKNTFDLLPDIMKYFGLELDISYHPLNWPSQKVLVDPTNTKFKIDNNGLAINAAFLFLFRYGFMPNSEVPFGRLQPYIGIGPEIFFAKTFLNIGQDFQSQEADIGLAVESGIRYMIRKNVSLNIGFRYRYIPTHVDVDDTIFDAGRHYIQMNTVYNFFNIIMGAAYHF